MATTEETNYRDIGSVHRDWTFYNATQVVEFLNIYLDPNSHMLHSNSELNNKVETARRLATSNLVAWLETNSGMGFGTNFLLWQDWLKAHPPDGTRGLKGVGGVGR